MHVISAKSARGFTLIEVMVALVIIAIGMLGIAKLQGLAMSNTGVAKMRSIAALQATSLAAAMHANRAFWAATSNPQTFSNTHNSATNADSPGGTAVLGMTTACLYPTTCAPDVLAGADLAVWLQSVNANLPNAKVNVTCTAAVPAPNACTIELDWTEQMVNSNQQEVLPAATAAIDYPTYILDVVP